MQHVTATHREWQGWQAFCLGCPWSGSYFHHRETAQSDGTHHTRRRAEQKGSPTDARSADAADQGSHARA